MIACSICGAFTPKECTCSRDENGHRDWTKVTDKDYYIRNLHTRLEKVTKENDKLEKDNIRFRCAVFSFLEVMSEGDIEKLVTHLKEHSNICTNLS